MKLANAIAALLAIPVMAAAQITRAGGIVVDSVTGHPIEGALVTLSGNGYGQSVSSHEDGSFRFTKVTAGT